MPTELVLPAAAAVFAAAIVVSALLYARRRRRRLPRGPQRPEPVAPPAPAARPKGMRAALAAARAQLAGGLDRLLGTRSELGEPLFAELEELLVRADVGVAMASRLVGKLRERARTEGAPEPWQVRAWLAEELIAALDGSQPGEAPAARPWVILVTGVNGVGKTTSIGKLAARHRAQGRRVLLVAADTFRAAAIEQLGIWAERTGAEFVRQKPGADPAAVAFDGVRAAKARGIDVAIVDTAGRLHTRSNLVEELRKITRVIGRELPGAPHETLLVLDATTGQNALSQARTFKEAVGVTGIILTKLDGTARGGIVVAVRHELGVPVRYVGTGEGTEDLRPFVASEFVTALVGEGSGEGGEGVA